MASRMVPHPAVLGLRVLTMMHQRGLSIPKLARQSGVALAAVQRIVAGKSHAPSVWTLVAFANVLDVSLDYLTGRTDAPEGQRAADACAPEAPLTPPDTTRAHTGVPAVQPAPIAPAPPQHPRLSLPAPQYRCLDCGGTDFWDSGSRLWCRQCTSPPRPQGRLLRARR